MAAELPVVFFAFANDQDRHLATLKQESRAIFQALQPLEQESAITIHREESAEFDELYSDLLNYHDRIVIFHYAGHADGTSLQLEGGSGGANGIAGLLGQQSSLKLVFLNGCATKDQVKLLHDAGVPAVIATAVKISDSKATKLSTAFYAALAQGQNIYEAFESARSYIEGKFTTEDNLSISVNRHPNFDFSDNQEPASLEFEWTLYTRADAISDLEQWRLPKAREAWQIQLQDHQGPIKNAQDELIQTEHRQRVRSVLVNHCQRCGSKTSITKPDIQVCPVCHAANTQQQQVDTGIPDLRLPFQISIEKARAIAAGALGVADEQAVTLTMLNLPYWQFDVDTQTSISGQRGQIKDVHAQTLELEWHDVAEQVQLNLKGYLVPAFSGTPSVKTNSATWFWDYENSKPMQQLDLSKAMMPLETSIESGFTQVAAYLQDELRAQASERVGGQQQKNINTDIRYTNVSIRSILLPHWCATVEQPAGKTSIVINGQNGAIKFPATPDMPLPSDQGELSMNNKNTTTSDAGKSSLLVSIYSGAGIGVMVGLLMGLAAPQGADAKSIVAVFIGAVGVGLAALLGLNDRHFSMAKGLRIGSFGLAVAISGLAGIYVRDNNLLSPDIVHRAAELKAIFPQMSDDKLLSLLSTEETTTTDAEGKVTVTKGQLKDLRSAMFSSGGVDRSVCAKLRMSNEDEARAKGVLQNFRYRDGQGEFGWKNLADEVEKKQLPESDQKALLFIARDAACGFVANMDPILPDSQQCQNMTSTQISSGNIGAIFASHNDLSQVLKMVDAQISVENRDVALKLLGPVLCSNTITMEK